MSEQVFEHDWFSKPGDSVVTLMRRRAVPTTALAERLGTGLNVVRDLMSGVARIDDVLADRISEVLGGTRAFWLKRQADYDRALEKAVAAVDEAETKAIVRHVPIPKGMSADAAPSRRATELRHRLAFYNVNSLEGWRRRYGRTASEMRFRTSQAFTSEEGPLALWLRQAELEADLIQTADWNPDALQDRIPEIRSLSRLSRPSRFLPRLRTILAECGVALAVVRAPQGCRASGASQLLSTSKAMIVVSFRHRSDDQFWFTLFHEIGHLVLHGGMAFIDDDEAPGDELEDEANRFASECIVPDNRRAEFRRLRNDRDDIIRFSVSLGVAPGLIVGQMQHRAMIGYDKRNSLKRRYAWDEIESGAAELA